MKDLSHLPLKQRVKRGPLTIVKPTPWRPYSKNNTSRASQCFSPKPLTDLKLDAENFKFQNADAFVPPFPPPVTMGYEHSAEVSDESSVESVSEEEHQHTKNVHFHPQVSVRFIPSRHAYKPSDKTKIWSSRDELQQMVKRNSFEFAYESFRWQHAIEEDEFVNVQGRHIHPAYIMGYGQRRHSSK